MAEYYDFLKTVIPVTLSMTSSSTELDRREYWARRGGPLERAISARYRLLGVQSDFFDIEASYEFMVRVVEREPKDAAVLMVPVRIACTVQAHFHADETVARVDAERFAQEDAWLIFWPYFRQFVSDATGRMGIQPEILPLGLGPGKYAVKTAERKQVESKRGAKKTPRRRTGRVGK